MESSGKVPAGARCRAAFEAPACVSPDFVIQPNADKRQRPGITISGTLVYAFPMLGRGARERNKVAAGFEAVGVVNEDGSNKEGYM